MNELRLKSHRLASLLRCKEVFRFNSFLNWKTKYTLSTEMFKKHLTYDGLILFFKTSQISKPF